MIPTHSATRETSQRVSLGRLRGAESATPSSSVEQQSLHYNHWRMKLSEIADALDVRLENGSPDTEITGVAGIETAGPGETHVYFESEVRGGRADDEGCGGDCGGRTSLLSPRPCCAAIIRIWILRGALELFHPATRYAAGSSSDSGD